jgi:hypothetical protein
VSNGSGGINLHSPLGEGLLMSELSMPMQSLIRALARAVAEDYLREEALRSNAAGEQRPTPVPLHDIDQAA